MRPGTPGWGSKVKLGSDPLPPAIMFEHGPNTHGFLSSYLTSDTPETDGLHDVEDGPDPSLSRTTMQLGIGS